MIGAIVIAVVLGFVICKSKHENTETWELRSYEVPPERANEVRDVLDGIFFEKNNDTRPVVRLFGNGLLLVRAPNGIQSGISELVASAIKQPPTKKQTVRTDYWLVAAVDADKGELAPPGLKDVFTSIEKSTGSGKFRVVEHLSSLGVSGQQAIVKGSIAENKITGNSRGENVELKIQVNSALGDVQLNTIVKAGETLVIGQNGVLPGAWSTHVSGPMSTLLDNLIGKNRQRPIDVFHIIRTELID